MNTCDADLDAVRMRQIEMIDISVPTQRLDGAALVVSHAAVDG